MKFKNNIEVQAGVEDNNASAGTPGQVLSSTGTGVEWINQDAISSSANFVYFTVKNETGATIPRGAGVMAVGSDGNSGNILIDEFIADGSVEPKYFLGLMEDSIASGAFGRAVSFGEIDQINTNAFNDGDVLWTDPAVPGGLTTTEPDGPNTKLAVAIVLNSSTNGKVFCRVQANEGIHDLHDTKITSQVDGDVLVWDDTTGVWFNDSTLNVDYTNSRVGIGTTNPEAKLEIYSDSFNLLRLKRSTVANYEVHLGGAGEFYLRNVIASQYPLTILANGNVGIGTTSPSEKLHVEDGRIQVTSYNGPAYISTATIPFGAATFGTNTSGVGYIESYNGFTIDTPGLGVGGNANYNEIFTVNSTTKASSPVPVMTNSDVSNYMANNSVQSGQMVYNYESDRLLIGTYTSGFSYMAKWGDQKNYFRSVATTPINTYSSYTLSWFSVTYWNITLQANTIFGQSSYPGAGYGQQMQIVMTGNYTPTFPSNWQLSPSSDSYDGTQRNLITAIYHGYDFNTGTHLIYYTIENMDTASGGGGGSTVNENFEFTIDTFQGGFGPFFAMYLYEVNNGTITVNWGDGTTTTHSGGYIDHFYPFEGTYNISISGHIYGQLNSNTPNFGVSITQIDNWGNYYITPDCFAFNMSMSIFATDAPIFSGLVTGGAVFGAFQSCFSIDPDISKWDVSEIQYFDAMFDNCYSLNQSFDTWNITNAQSFSGFIQNTGTSPGNYSKTLLSWALQDPQGGVYFTGNPWYLFAANNARDTLVSQYGWQIFDNGLAPY